MPGLGIHPGEAATVPALHRRHAPRPRLTRLLDQSTAQAILITAPAGYGKTSLACEWLGERPQVAWYRARPASADLAAFSVGIAAVIAPLVPGGGERLRQRLRVGEPPEAAARPLAELLADDLAGWPEGAWLVVDDYHHVIDSAAVEEFMDWLLTLAPAVRVLVTTRRRPRWASARRVLYGEITEVTKEQLAMTSEEAALVLDRRPRESVRALVMQAQGWPALIGLAALSTSAELPSERLAEGLFRYFAEEVFRREPAEVQEFMLVASVPQAVSPEIAREALGVEEPEGVLGRLLEEGLLQESGPGEFAFHPLLREFLERKLETEHPDLATSLEQEVVAHARAAGRWDEAFHLTVRRGQLDVASEIIGEASPSLFAAGRVETIEKWLGACGAAVLRHPGALLARADVLIRQGRLAEALGFARDVGEHLADDHPDVSRAWHLAGQAAHLSSRDEQALELQLKAYHRAHTAADLVHALWGALISAAELELDEIDDYLSNLERVSPDDPDSRLRLATGRMVACQRRGSIAELGDVDRLLPLVDYSDDPMVKSSFLAQLSYLNVLRARYHRALDLALLAESICRDMRLGIPETLCQITRAGAQLGLRQFRSARKTITALRDRAVALEDPSFDAAVSVLTLKLALSERVDLPLLESLVRNIPTSAALNLRGELLSLYALSAATHGDTNGARDYARLAMTTTRSIEASYHTKFADLIVRIIEGSPANVTLEAVSNSLMLELRTNDILDSLVLAYRSFPPLLELLESVASEHWDTISRLLAVANDLHFARQVGISLGNEAQCSTRLQSLTKRELEILTLMCEGLSNAEIAQRLVISLNTAKVHVHNVLSKLGTRTRLQAVLLAQSILEDNGETGQR